MSTPLCNQCGRFPARRTAAGPRCAEHEGWAPKESKRADSDLPPRQPAIDVDPAHPAVPDKARKAVASAAAHGWWWSLQRAETGDGRHLLTLRARRHDNRQQVAMIWEYVPPHWTVATKNRESRWIAEATWVNREAWLAPWRPATHTDVAKVLAT